MKDNNIIFQSTYDNINDFIKDKPLDKLVNLYMYIMGSESMNRPPDEFEKDFIKEFFTHEAWAEFIQYRKKEKEGKTIYFKHIPPFDLHTISGILSFEIMKKMERQFNTSGKAELKLNIARAEKKLLKSELKIAILGSYFDGVFDKCDGWCNVADVLVKHKLITLKED